MNKLLLQALLTATLIISYFITLAIIGSAIKKFGTKQRFLLDKRIAYIKKIIISLLFSVLLVILALIWGIDIGGVLIFASSFFAIVGIALFAFWSVLSNITSGVIIFFLFPYRIGNKIKIVDGENSITGKIVDMTLFHIQMTDEDDNQISYPNNLVIQKPVVKLKS